MRFYAFEGVSARRAKANKPLVCLYLWTLNDRASRAEKSATNSAGNLLNSEGKTRLLGVGFWPAWKSQGCWVWRDLRRSLEKPRQAHQAEDDLQNYDGSAGCDRPPRARTFECIR